MDIHIHLTRYLKKLLTDLSQIIWNGRNWTKEKVIKFWDWSWIRLRPSDERNLTMVRKVACRAAIGPPSLRMTSRNAAKQQCQSNTKPGS